MGVRVVVDREGGERILGRLFQPYLGHLPVGQTVDDRAAEAELLGQVSQLGATADRLEVLVELALAGGAAE